MIVPRLLVAVLMAFTPGRATDECLIPPVVAPVVVPFRAPSCPYCAGQRGIEYQVGAAVPVHAVASGRVVFSGVVVGIRYVVIEHLNGVLATYGMLVDVTVHRDVVVRSGQLVGHASTRLYFGVRRAGEYVDPLSLFDPARLRPRLVPLDDAPARAARRHVPACTFVAETRANRR